MVRGDHLSDDEYVAQSQDSDVVESTAPPAASAAAIAPTSEEDRLHTFKLLVATDNHLGYAEKDPVRGYDSFRTFEEILKTAKKQKVDLLLLGGDLFHDNKPSRRTLFHTMSLLRKYCMGDGAIQYQIVSDQSINFPHQGFVNYEDPNYNVELPIFSIHGNHDDPIREGGSSALAALDILNAANLVNYFGKSEKVDNIEIFPILMRKGDTKLAIYGLGNVRDERLNRMFAQKQVKFRRPVEFQDEWFNIFVVHQNRDNRGRGTKNCVHESFIPEFIDFVVWGHEHECLIEINESLQGKFYLTQPGSSVATSLVEGEARPKHVGLLEIRDQDFRLTPVALETVRPFILNEIVLSNIAALNPDDPDISTKINRVLAAKVSEMIVHARDELRSNGKDDTVELLVRLKVEHTGFPTLSNQRFGSQFVSKIANPGDILLFHRRKTFRNEKSKNPRGLSNPIVPIGLDAVQVEDLVSVQLEQAEKKLSLLPETLMNRALEDYVYKNMPNVFSEMVDQILEDTQNRLQDVEKTRSAADIIEAVEKKTKNLRVESTSDPKQAPLPKALPFTSMVSASADDNDDDVVMAKSPVDDDFGFDQDERHSKPTRKKKPLGTSVSHLKENTQYDIEDDDDYLGDLPSSPVKASSFTKGGRRKPPATMTSRRSSSSSKTLSPSQRSINSLFSSTNSLKEMHHTSQRRSRKPVENAYSVNDDEVEQDLPFESDFEVTQMPATATQASMTQNTSKRRLPLSMAAPSQPTKRGRAGNRSILEETLETESSRGVAGTQMMKSWGNPRRT